MIDSDPTGRRAGKNRPPWGRTSAGTFPRLPRLAPAQPRPRHTAASGKLRTGADGAQRGHSGCGARAEPTVGIHAISWALTGRQYQELPEPSTQIPFFPR